MIKDHYNHLPRIRRELDNLSGKAVVVGILPKQSEFLQMIAVVNEYGAHIKPKKGKYLYVPGPKGKVYQLKSVDIPARSFLRSTYDAKHRKWEHTITAGAHRIVRSNGEVTANQVMTALGVTMQKQIRKSISRKKKPANAPLTVANKGKNDPLVDTCKLGNSIKYKITKRGKL